MRYGRVCFFVFLSYFKGAMFLRDYGVCGCTLPTILGFRNQLAFARITMEFFHINFKDR